MKKSIQLILFLSILSLGLNAQIWDQAISGNSSSSIQEGEAHIAINPSDSNQMVMGYVRQSSNSIGFQVFHSNNGGNSWQASTLNTNSYISADFPGHTVIGGGDIIFAYDKSGKLYSSWIYLLANVNAANPYDTCIWTSYWASSMNNGANFTLENGNDRFFGLGKLNLNSGLSVHDYLDGICDRQWMAIDLTTGTNQNNLYVGYINYPYNLTQTGLKVKTKAGGQSTFGSAKMAYPGNGQLSNLGVDKNGILHYTFADIVNEKIYHVSSTDGGQSFSSAHEIYSGTRLFPQGNTHVNDRENAAPSFAIDGNNNLHLVWGDFPIGQQPSAYYAYSTNGGSTWSTIVDLSTIFGSKVFMPVVSTYQNRVTIGAYVLNSDNKSNYFVASSIDNGQSFGTPAKVSSGITDFDAVGGAVWVGDYSSSVRTECYIYSLWTDCRANGCKQYVAKYNECNPIGLVELTPIQSNFSLEKIYPIPANDHLTLQIVSEIDNQVSVEIFNSNGQQIIRKSVALSIGEQTYNMPISNLAAGSYIIRLSNPEGTFITRTFVKK